MENNFQSRHLKELCLNITDGVHSTVIDDPNGDYLLLSCKNIKNDRINISDSDRRISKETFDKLTKRTKIAKGDILLTTVGTIGEMAIIKDDNPNYDFQRSVGIIKPDPSKVVPAFLYYAIKNEISQINTLVKGAVQKCLFIGDIKEIVIKCPSISMQKRISSILSSIDRKIELNDAVNYNLEDQIKAIFKHYSKLKKQYAKKIGEMPLYITDYVANGSFASLKENVRLYQEENYAVFIRNTDLKDGEFNVYVDKHSYEFLSKSSLKGNEIIVSNVGDIGSVFLCPALDKPMTLGNNVIMIEPTDPGFKYYLYCWLKWFDGQQLMQGIKGGSAVPKFNKTEFKSILFEGPSEKEIKDFNDTVEPLFIKISKNKAESSTLKELRNALLKKLISGEIDVSKVKIEE